MADPPPYLVLCVCGDGWWRLSCINPKVTSQASCGHCAGCKAVHSCVVAALPAEAHAYFVRLWRWEPVSVGGGRQGWFVPGTLRHGPRKQRPSRCCRWLRWQHLRCRPFIADPSAHTLQPAWCCVHLRAGDFSYASRHCWESNAVSRCDLLDPSGARMLYRLCSVRRGTSGLQAEAEEKRHAG